MKKPDILMIMTVRKHETPRDAPTDTGEALKKQLNQPIWLKGGLIAVKKEK